MRVRSHALVLLVVVALVAPAGPVASEQSADPFWAQGHQLMRRGDYADAAATYASMVDQFGTAIAARALVLQSRAALADGDTDTAEALLQRELTQYPSSDQTVAAYFGLEQVRRAAGNCPGALRALDAFEQAAGRLAIGPYLALQRAQCAAKLGDWPAELAQARNALSIEDGGPRLTKIEGYERAAEASLQLGRKMDALDFYDHALDLAGTPAYKAEMLFTTATVAHALGRDDLALERFRAVVVDYADQARAPGALDALNDLGGGQSISPLQAGLVRFNGEMYRDAVALLDQVDPTSPDWGKAQLTRAEALGKLNRDDEMRQTLSDLAQSDDLQAGAALLRLGRLAERDGDPAAAETFYQRVPDVATDRVAEAFFHIGFTRFVRGDSNGALAAWQTGMASGPPAPAMQAQLLYWSTKVSSTDPEAAREALQRAIAVAPESYYGLRAQEHLESTLAVAAVNQPASASWLWLSPKELQDRAAWQAAHNTTPQQVVDDLAALPGLQRADALLELGLSAEASWEIDAVAQQYAQAQDAVHLDALADWLTARELPQLSMKVGRQMRDLVGLENLPRAAQKQVYPAAWGDLVAEQAARQGVDPLLALALIRQESSFDPRAQSGAQARGLTQIVPATARNIAGQLARSDFVVDDLFKPAVSLEFGTWFLSHLLSDYQGRVFPALAAYDAGGGNVTRWLQRYGDDPDVLVEEIPFAETQTYLRIVYDNYLHYLVLYRSN
jgi:soluble lytic murein transglycosylase